MPVWGWRGICIYAHFISPEHAGRACDTYREEFRPSEQLAEPLVTNLGTVCKALSAKLTADRYRWIESVRILYN